MNTEQGNGATHITVDTEPDEAEVMAASTEVQETTPMVPTVLTHTDECGVIEAATEAFLSQGTSAGKKRRKRSNAVEGPALKKDGRPRKRKSPDWTMSQV